MSDFYRYPDFPDQVYVELTNACNARCTICATPTMLRKRSVMPFELFRKIIDECGRRGARKILPFLHGETLLVPGVLDYTDRGRLLGHIVIGSEMVGERIRSLPGFPPRLELELLHILISHHGEHAWGSPKRPKTIEALLVHYVEDLDAKVAGFQDFMRHSKDPLRPHWTSYHKVFERYLYLRSMGEENQQGGEKDGP